MSNHGGKRDGAGRPKKSDEAELIERLKKFDDIAEQKLIEGVQSGSYPHLKIFYEYRYGKPKQLIGVVTENETLEQVFKIGGVEIKL